MRNVAIVTGPSTHLDHLGVLSSLIDIPLIVTDEHLLDSAKTFYPNLRPELKYLDELTIDYLSHHFDTIFETGKFFATQLKPFLQLLFRKEMRFVFCPHGNSDKGHSLREHADQDISLIYGDHLKDLLEETGAAKKIGRFARTGNYRYPYYLQHREFFDQLAEEKVFRQFQGDKPIILYAPTWSDKENPSSFFESIDHLIEELAPSYHLLIKLHPFLMEDHPAHTYAMMARYEHNSSVCFLTDFPPIYPLLSRCALYLGDYSSIGYDFLAFDRPLYFVRSNQSSPLHSCGMQVPVGKEKSINTFISRTWRQAEESLSAHRKKVYEYAFGEPVLPERIKQEISNTMYK